MLIIYIHVSHLKLSWRKILRSFNLVLNEPFVPSLLQPIISNSDLKKYNALRKKNKCNVNLNNIASVQGNYMSIFTNKNWLKRIVNIIIKTICSHFIFVASLPVGCVCYGVDYQITKLNLHHTTPYKRDTEVFHSFDLWLDFLKFT